MEITLSFLGAAQNVTGSCYLLQANDAKVLIDCGLYQERQLRERNWNPFAVPASSINAVLLTHAHLDHSGLLPKLVQEGFRGKIYCTTATAEIAQIVLQDCGHLQEEDAEFKRKRHEREGRKGPYPELPLYTIEDAKACIPLFCPAEYRQPTYIANGIEASFYDAGHILGSSMIKVRLRQNGQERVILFSGDLGSWDKPILRDPTVLEQADYVVVESTYGDRLHEQADDVSEALADVVNSVHQAGGNVVIPSFAVERAQEVLYHLNKALLEDEVPHLLVFLDSPMATNVTKIFKHHPELFDREMTQFVNQKESPFSFPGLTLVNSVEESKAINHIKGTSIIIAGSGMCTGGRVKHHLVNNISRPESTILFVGYQAAGTLGRRILDGDKEVRILGQIYPVRAKVARVNGFSSHADRDELAKWLAGLKQPPKNVFVVHGEAETTQHFADYLRTKTGWQISVPGYQDEIALN